jgi:phage gp46-like protein
MGDIALQWDLDAGGADLYLEDDDLASDEGLRTAVLLSLFTDRRADEADVLPGEDDDRRGWWADEFAAIEGDLFGSRLWLLDRGKILSDTAARAKSFAEEALAWLIEDRVASAIDVQVLIDGHVLSMVVVITRPTGDEATYRFSHVWEGEAANAV